MNDVIKELYSVILDRRANPHEGSYTCYLFDKGLDKILKKVGEECSEVIIASKNDDHEAQIGEVSDLMYHLCVLMAQLDIDPDEIGDELKQRSQKIGNLKKFHVSDHES